MRAPRLKHLEPILLRTGQSITQTVTWDGTTSWLGQQIDHWGTFAVSSPGAEAGSTELFQIDSPLTSTLTTEKPTYAANEPVVITLQQTNSSDQPITFLTGSKRLVVQQNAAHRLHGTTAAVTVTSLQPGQSISQSATWNGIPAGSTDNKPASGSFVAYTSGAPQGPTASFTISPPDRANADAHNHSDPNPNRHNDSDSDAHNHSDPNSHGYNDSNANINR